MTEPVRFAHSLCRPQGRGGVSLPLVVGHDAFTDYGDFAIRSPDGRDVSLIPGHLVEPLGAALRDLVSVRHGRSLRDGYLRPPNSDDRLHLRVALCAVVEFPGVLPYFWSVIGRSSVPMADNADEARDAFPADRAVRTAHLAISVPWPFRKAEIAKVEGLMVPQPTPVRATHESPLPTETPP